MSLKANDKIYPDLQMQNREESIQIEKLHLKITNFNLIESPATLKEVKWIIKQATKILRQLPTVLHLSLPVKIVGDVCGHYKQLTQIFETIGSPSNRNYLFLGNYVGKGPNSIKSLITLLYFQIKYPQTFFMLRGRCQVPETNFMFGFYEECANKYSKQLWNEFNELFNSLPLNAVIDKQIFCSSSGIMPEIKTIEQLNNISRTSEMTEVPQIVSFLSSRPKQTNRKKSQFTQKEEFSYEMTLEWMRKNNFTLMVRSNEVLEEGLQFSFNNQVLTICSVPNFMNVKNMGIVVSINQNCELSFQALKATK